VCGDYLIQSAHISSVILLNIITPVGVETEMWTPKSFLGGHFESVNDLVWSPSSEYVLTVSSDQTCRLHAPVLRTDRADAYDNNLVTPMVTSNSATSSIEPHQRWREVSRPQIHGYDLHSIAVAPSSSSYLLYSAADEKLIRVFDAPSGVIDGLMTLCGVDRTQPSTQHTGALRTNLPYY
jgi:elongator complex protein 2